MAKPIGNNGDEIISGPYEFEEETINGGNGNDEIWGDNGGDVLNGENGMDTLHASYGYGEDESGNWLIIGDELNGGNGDDMLYGNVGGDIINGGNGNDHLYTGENLDDSGYPHLPDILDGGRGDDVLHVEHQYFDWYYGYGGVSAILTGGKGDDKFDFTDLGYNDGDSSFDHMVEIKDFGDGNDTIIFSDYWLHEPPTDPGEYVENLADAGSLAQLGADAALAHDAGADYYFGVFNGDGYLISDDIGDGWGTVIKLTGVTDLDATDITIA